MAKKITYNSDFTELIDEVLQELRLEIRNNFNWTSIMNGYKTGTNNEYYNGFTYNGNSFPAMFKLSVFNDWKFVPWNGLPMDSDSDWISSDVGGGRVIYDSTLRFRLEMQVERMDIGILNGFTPEKDEFLEIEPIDIFVEMNQKDESRRKITKQLRGEIISKVTDKLPIFLDNIEIAITKQAKRRWQELYKADKKVAEKYMPDEVKDVFIF